MYNKTKARSPLTHSLIESRQSLHQLTSNHVLGQKGQNPNFLSNRQPTKISDQREVN